jgi:hypothetical protein
MSARTRTKAAAVFAVTAALAFAAAPAYADTAVSTVSGGSLSVTTAGATLTGVTLNGTNQTATGTASAAWSIVDARGTGAAWTVAVTATVPTSAAGSTELTPRTLPVGGLSMTTGTVTAGTGSDPITNITGSSALAMSGSSQTLVASSGTNKGTYAVTPTFSLDVPANAFRSNYAVGSSGALNPYSSTVTYTIA